jgi:hypothetical protein
LASLIFAPLIITNRAYATVAVDMVVQGDPDQYRIASDGIDDAPSIQRLINNFCNSKQGNTIYFRARHYAIHSPILQTCLVNWKGQGWPDTITGPASQASGTWLDIGAEFANTQTSPLVFTGTNASGMTVEDIALDEPAQPAAPILQNGSWYPATWAPTPYFYMGLA